MKVSMITPTLQHKNNTQFKGLWGNEYYTHSESLYGGEFDCAYYKKPYHPCKDESKEQTQLALRSQQNELDKFNRASAMSASGSYTGVTIGTPLKITQKELHQLQQDSQNIIHGNLPKHNLDLVM